MTQPFNVNEFRRQQLQAGQVPHGQPQIPLPVAQPQAVPQYAPQNHQPPPMLAQQRGQQPYQHMPPQAYGAPQYQQAPRPQMQPPQAPHFAPPHAAEPVVEVPKKSLFKRGQKTPKVKKAKPPADKRATSPAIIFAAGLMTGLIAAVAGLTLMGNLLADKTDKRFKEIAAASAITASDTSTPSEELSSVQNQLKAVEELDVPAKP